MICHPKTTPCVIDEVDQVTHINPRGTSISYKFATSVATYWNVVPKMYDEFFCPLQGSSTLSSQRDDLGRSLVNSYCVVGRVIFSSIR